MKIFHCAATSGLLSCLPMVYPACCPCCSSSLSGENDGSLLPLKNRSAACNCIPTAIPVPAVVLPARPVAQPPEEPTPTAPAVAQPPEEAAPASAIESRGISSAPIQPLAAVQLPESNQPAATGSAAQFWIRDSQAANASALTLIPQSVAGHDLSFSENTLSLAPKGVYFVSLLLKAEADGHFVEVIPQIDLALRHEFSACAKSSPAKESDSDAVGLSCGFLVNTAACTAPTALQFLFHTDSPRPLPVSGCISLFKVGVPFGD